MCREGIVAVSGRPRRPAPSWERTVHTVVIIWLDAASEGMPRHVMHPPRGHGPTFFVFCKTRGRKGDVLRHRRPGKD